MALILLDHWFPPSRSCRIDLGGFGCLHLFVSTLVGTRHSFGSCFLGKLSCLESPHSVWFRTWIFVSLDLRQNYNYVEPMGASGSTIPDGQRSSHNRWRSSSGFAAALLGAGQPAMAGHPDHPDHIYHTALRPRTFACACPLRRDPEPTPTKETDECIYSYILLSTLVDLRWAEFREIPEASSSVPGASSFRCGC